MFSQLCRARPRTLWDKISLRQPPASECFQEANRVQRGSEIELVEDDSRCQLEHCTFCDFRVCCQVTSYEWEEQQLTTDSQLKATENPAYGLSSKNRLETTDYENAENVPSQFVGESMESAFHEVHPNKDARSKDSPVSPKCPPSGKKTSQKDPICDGDTVPTKMNPFNVSAQSCNQTKTEPKSQRINLLNERSKSDTQKTNDQKHECTSWSELKHRQLSGETPENCDKSNSCVIEHSLSDKLSHDPQLDSKDKGALDISVMKPKRNIIDRTFPLSLMKPIAKMADKKLDVVPQQFSHAFKTDLSRQRPVQKATRDKLVAQTINRNKSDDPSRRFSSDVLAVNNPLSEIAQIKTEESIQEWLARISDSTNYTGSEDEQHSDRSSSWSTGSGSDQKSNDTMRNKLRSETTQVLNKGLQEALKMSQSKPHLSRTEQKDTCDAGYRDTSPEQEPDTLSLLHSASKASPANIPMVVMQCSRLHSHIGSKPPYQQSSLPMGTLVTALYQESDWLYVQTPHGVEGFIIASNCVPIGTINDPAHTSRRPWEPCDFPIEINIRKKCEYGRLQGAYIPAKLPTSNSKQATPYVSTVKMKTNFYSDRYFSHTFKSKDSIKTAKTVTDILRNSPETKVSNQ